MGLVRGQMDDGEDDKLTLQRKDLWHQTGGPESNRSLSAHCFGLGSGLHRRQQRRIRNSVTRSILGTPGNGNGSRAVNHPWSELRRGRKSGERREGGEEKRSLYERCWVSSSKLGAFLWQRHKERLVRVRSIFQEREWRRLRGQRGPVCVGSSDSEAASAPSSPLWPSGIRSTLCTLTASVSIAVTRFRHRCVVASNKAPNYPSRSLSRIPPCPLPASPPDVVFASASEGSGHESLKGLGGILPSILEILSFFRVGESFE